MATTKEISEAIKGYSISELIELKLKELTEQRRELDRQEQEARSFLKGKPVKHINGVSKKKTVAAPKKKVKEKSGGHNGSRQSRIRAFAEKNGLSTIDGIVGRFDWGSEAGLPVQKKKAIITSAVKQMVRHGQMRVVKNKDGFNEYGV
jgi:hypothetical protein